MHDTEARSNKERNKRNAENNQKGWLITDIDISWLK